MRRSWSRLLFTLPVHKENHGELLATIKNRPIAQDAVLDPPPPHRHGAVRPLHRRNALSGQCLFELFDEAVLIVL